MSDGIDAMPGFTFGCDPELFIKDHNGRHVSAEGLIPGTKAEPYKVNGGAVQVDGMAAEFNIDPVTTFDEFNANITRVMKTLKTMLPTGYTLDASPAVTFDADVWAASPEKAKELGCSPDFNAWTGDVNAVPECLEAPTLRTASGHIHIGWTEDEPEDNLQHIMNCRDLVKQLDWFLGGWSLQLDPSPTRRLLYGKAGACRYKSYGVEYRVLSNFWLKSASTRLVVWNRMQMAIHKMRSQFMPDKAGVHNPLLIDMINKSARNTDLEAGYRYPLTSINY